MPSSPLPRALLFVLWAATPGCGARSSLEEEGGAASGGASSCAVPEGVVPVAPPPDIPPQVTEQFRVTIHNRCDLTIWPAWTSVGGLDQSVADADFWAPIPAGQEHTSTFHYFVVQELSIWARTGCRFDAEGAGACDTGDCGDFPCFDESCSAFVCPELIGGGPTDATAFNIDLGYGLGFNLPMRVTAEGCAERVCALDVATQCPVDARVTTDCGLVTCTEACADIGGCCPRSDDCMHNRDLDVTFCP